MTQSYLDLNCLTEVSFIGGNEYTFKFVIYDEDSVLVDISSATMEWNLSLYGQQDYNIITKAASIFDVNTFSVTLLGSETEGLVGKYLQQGVITDFGGSEFIPGQGIVTILAKISNT